MHIPIENTCPNVCSDTDGAAEMNIKETSRATKLMDIEDEKSWGPHKMAVVVPFRDRIEALVEFAPFMHNYLNKRKIRHAFYVINQGDNFRFNRGALINIGYIESRAECDHICMHDVDTIPVNPNITYPYPEKGPFHVSSPDIHPRNHYKSFVGGILIIRNEHFKELNGFSNRYWGWGAEDDDFGIRMRTKRLTIYRHIGIKTGNLTFPTAT
ncbi:hypothetical protein KUTeg_004864 [Tegillarca granosa]|uniref:Beta-1,4-galactosyltransferase n=1 Tax=Tegillarca granosa TaxID=220873 RepID=A0ABQ9FL05_TEGGR|nr:hypothetical protein KUTeg_004864 [Tegillarca granosa]